MTTPSTPDVGDDAPASTSRSPRPDAGRRTVALSALLTIAAVFGMRWLDLDAEVTARWSLPFWAVAALTIVVGFMVFDVEFRRETYTFTFSEIVLVVGLFFATPLQFIAGRLLGEFVFLTVRERQPLRKLVMNLSAFFAESVAFLAIQQALRPVLDVTEPQSWVVALVAVIGAELVGFAAISTVIRWHGGPITMRSIIQIGLLTAPANTSLSLVVCVLAQVAPAAVPLLAGVAVFLVVTYRSYSSLKQRYDSLSLLYDFTHLVNGVREPDVVLDAMLTQAKDLLRAERAEFWLVGTETRAFRRHVVDDTGHESFRQEPSPVIDALLAEFATERDSIVIGRDAGPPGQSVLEAVGATDAILAPIREGDDVIGLVVVANRLSEISRFDAQDVRLFTTLASHAGVALQNGRLIVRLHEQARQREYEALHDPLTGLPNRAMFTDRLVGQLGEGSPPTAVIALMDLDGFKEINDTLGHQSGDAVLIEVADRLRAAIPDGSLVARLGGDEFALIASSRLDRYAFEQICWTISRAVADPIEIDHVTVNMGVSIGIASAPDHGRDADVLVRRADVAMYTAKAGRGRRVTVYDPDLDDNTPRRLSLAHDLRHAIESGQLEVVYQPKIELATGAITGLECLCRWEHPTFGPVMPDEFIPLADRTGAIGPLTRWMLSTAVASCERWASMGVRTGVSVNVSMRNLLDRELVGVVQRVLSSTSIDPEQLTLEITETHVMSDAVRTARVLEELASLGVRLSIDDFGTGYSSLAYLQRLPVHEVKIDKVFVLGLGRERGAEAIVRSVIDLARNLGLDVVAEGVEDESVRDRLRELGCREAQGYLFARPMSATDAELSLLGDRAPRRPTFDVGHERRGSELATS